MRKFLLSVFVAVIFIAYSIYQRVQGGSPLGVISSTSTSPSPETTSTSVVMVTPRPTIVLTTPSTTVQAVRTPLPTPVFTQRPTPSPTPNSGYKNGTYVGDVADAFYGNLQVQITIGSGNITDVQFLQYPNDRSRSIEINSQAMPYLRQETIQAQSANVDIVSGATASSEAFVQSLQSALQKAKS